MTSTNKNNQKKQSWRGLILWALLALFLRWQIVEPRWIPSGSMIPTLQIYDKILVEKVRPRANLALKKHLTKSSLVIFKPPKALTEAGYEKSSALIKRVVGLPGDEIEISDGKLLINHNLINEPWILEPMKYTMKPVVIPEGTIWVLGDNRNNSLDSHLWGPLPESNVIGTAIFRYWPLSKFGPI